jgi:hypothetical protein
MVVESSGVDVVGTTSTLPGNAAVVEASRSTSDHASPAQLPKLLHPETGDANTIKPLTYASERIALGFMDFLPRLVMSNEFGILPLNPSWKSTDACPEFFLPKSLQFGCKCCQASPQNVTPDASLQHYRSTSRQDTGEPICLSPREGTKPNPDGCTAKSLNKALRNMKLEDKSGRPAPKMPHVSNPVSRTGPAGAKYPAI